MSEVIHTEEELRHNRAAKILFDRIMRHCHGKFMTKKLVEEVEQLVYNHRSECRRKGLMRFPHLVVLPLVEQGAVHTFPADLDEKGIQTTVLNLTVQYPNVSIRDLVNGVHHAWPDFKGVDNMSFARPETMKLAQ